MRENDKWIIITDERAGKAQIKGDIYLDEEGLR